MIEKNDRMREVDDMLDRVFAPFERALAYCVGFYLLSSVILAISPLICFG